jgi:hypothetical protein
MRRVFPSSSRFATAARIGDRRNQLAAAPTSRAAHKETLVDPLCYPQIKRAPGIFKVKLANAESHFLVREALEGQQIKRIKLTPTQIGTI